jgi:hypothetical protein
MDIMDKQLKTTPIINFVTQYRKKWNEHVHRMTPDRIPKIILKYQPKGKRCLGRPLKRWQYCYVTPVTGHKAYTGKEEEEDI